MSRIGCLWLLLTILLGTLTQGCTPLRTQLTHMKDGMNAWKDRASLAVARSAGNDPQMQVQTLCAALDSALLSCPDTVWPAVNWKDVSLIFMDNAAHGAWVWNGGGEGKLEQTDYSALPEGVCRSSPHGQGEWNGRKAVFLALDGFRKDGEGLLEVGLEEAFGLVGHDGWNTSGSEFFQGDLYPEEWPPRQLRRQLLQSLFKAFTDRDRTALAGSVYWHRKYRGDFPQDYSAMHFLDRMAGTAEYVAVLSTELGLRGCGRSFEQLQADLRERIRSQWPAKWGNLSWKGSAKDAEPYAIGSLAGLLLDQERVPDWRRRVAEGETPMEVLSDAVEASPVPDDDRTFEQVRAYYDEQNRQMKALLADFYQRQNSRDYLFLALPMNWLLPGSFDHKRLLAHKDEDYLRKFIIGMDGCFNSPSSPSKIEIKDATVEIIEAPYPLGGFGYYAIPVRSSHLKAGPGRTSSIASDTVTASDLAFEWHENFLSGKWIIVK